MSPNMKLSVLALVGAAAAVPQYNVGGHGHGHASAHSKHFTPAAGSSAHAYPTGGWGGYNATTPSAVAQGTGSPSKPAGEQTTDTDYTVTSTTTRTVYLTQYPGSAVPSVVSVKDVTSDAACGGETVYVTATNRVTVTVPAGGAASSAAPQAPSSSGYEAAKPSVPAAKPSVPAAKPSVPADTKGDVGSFAGNFIPTLRTLATAGDWASKAQAAIDAGSKVLFGLNEPDIASQANLDVPSLCSAWKEHMNDFHGKATIVGPSVSSSQDEGKGLSYLQAFVDQCPEAKFDDINIHWYGPASAGFDAFKAHYEDAASKFPGKKIWVTEFALTGATEDESADFLQTAQTYLDGEASCAGYSYFAVGTFDPTANLIGTMSALTKAGKVYVS
ncbi:glycoside hydrolase family 128 protein [Karstenula rhodostoma CBS 690.94]|uniref:Glycoside hydrolase family 128 protein n=1 Tax=Karstenula rhodostoma CBS 690.94 TaxID=1392251 RepID=A0A9P4UCR9_9PLEO|nr:glycoside hydrolase family 128 protein [Karstenula rhodostoma CBS 690.94]